MGEKVYYIDENGLINIIKGISNSIIQHTSGEITFTEEENPETQEIEKILNNPNNFPTVQAVVEYLKRRKKLNIVQDSSSPKQNGKYETHEHHKEYNGEEEVQIQMKLITPKDIQKLFR